jgi:sodium transport system permease protein
MRGSSLRVAKAIFNKEIREVRRDPRTLFLAVCIPLLFYPVIFLISSISQDQNTLVSDEGVLKVHVEGELGQELMACPGIEWVFKKPEKHSSFLLFKRQKSGYELFFQPTLQGELAKQHLLERVGRLKQQASSDKLMEMGVDPITFDGYTVKVTKQADYAEEIGLKFGGVVAYFIIFLAYTGCMSVAVDAGAGERERGTLEAMMVTPASLMSMGLGKLGFIFIAGMVSVLATLLGLAAIGIAKKNVFEAVLKVIDFTLMLQFTALMCFTVMFFAVVLYSLSQMAKSAREAHLQASLCMMLIVGLLIYSAHFQHSESCVWTFLPLINVNLGVAKVISHTLSWPHFALICFNLTLFSGLILFAVSHALRRHPERLVC